MTLAFEKRTISIPNGTGLRTINDTVSFDSRVRRAEVAISGFRLDYRNADHHIDTVEIDVDLLSRAGNDVSFRVRADYADQNNDDLYRGRVEVLVIADVE